MARATGSTPEAWEQLQNEVIACERCPRLRAHCTEVARVKRAAFRDWTYWGKPVPNLGSPDAPLLIVGLAPAAHGANRTGRMFTGDRSGDFLYRAMFEAGFANQPTAVSADDGLELIDVAIAASGRCAPPDNKPTREELANCFPFLVETLRLMTNLRGVLALGGIAFEACLGVYRAMGWTITKPKPRFAHGAVHRFDGAPALISSYHPSQQNTFTGRLTPAMMRGVLETAGKLVRDPSA